MDAILQRRARTTCGVLALAGLLVLVVSASGCTNLSARLATDLLSTGSTESATAEPTLTPKQAVSDAADEYIRRAPDAVPPYQGVRSKDIHFERISLERGLSDSTVFCILQDSRGFMWFGTHDGLNKYDGYDFTVYRHEPENPHSLSANAVRAIYEDRSGVLWIGTDGGGLNRFEREQARFVRYQNNPGDPHSLSDNNVRSIYEDRMGALWIGTAGGLNRFDADSGRFVRYQNARDDPGSLSNDSVTCIHEDRSGVLWIGTSGGGLNAFDRQNGQFVRYQTGPTDPGSLSSIYEVTTDPKRLSNDYVMSVYEDRFGLLWIGTWGGLDAFDRDAEVFVHYPNDPNDASSLSHNYVTSIYEDREGELWVGTGGGGLNRFDRGSGGFICSEANPDEPHSLSNNRIWSVYQDRSGVLWIGTGGGGLNKFDRETEKFPHYYTDPGDPNSLSHNAVSAIYQDQSGVLWIGTGGGGLNRFDRESGRFVHYQNDPDDPYSLSHNSVASILQDSSGTLWVGTFGGLDRFDRENERFIHYQNDPRDPRSLSSSSARSIVEDRSGVLWVGTGRGLDRFDGGTAGFAHYRSDPDDPHGLSHNNVLSVYEDRAGVLWIGTFGGGLNRLDQETEGFTHYQADPNDPHSLSNNNVAFIYEDSSGVLWVGTYGGGLNRLDRESGMFVHYRYGQENGLPDDTVYGILEDRQGYLWLSTNNGLSRFDPQAETFKNYDVRDGLQSNEFTRGACYKSSDGELFFGGVNGLNAFYPSNVQHNPYVPPIVLTSLAHGGEDLHVGQAVEDVRGVTVRWPGNTFEFEFAALSYTQPEKNQYAYVLEGFEEDWNYVGTRRFGRYTNVPGGTYTLRIKGSNNDGVWNELGVSVAVTVVPPFWETWWFRGVAALALVGFAVGGYRLRVKSIEARSRQLEQQVEERTREIERRRRVAEGLREILVILNSDRSLEESLDYIVSRAALLMGAGDAFIFRYEESHPAGIVVVAGEELEAPMAEWLGRAIQAEQPLIVPDLMGRPDAPAALNERASFRWRAITPLKVPFRWRAILGIPLTVGEGEYGGLVLSYVQRRDFSEEDLELGFTFADQAVLAIANAQLRDRAEQTAAETERNRLARDLHDAVTQTLFSASLIAEALPAVWRIDEAEGLELLAEMRRLSRGALAEMRTLLLELRPTALIEASLGDLMHQLAETVTGRKDVAVAVEVEGQCTLPCEVHVALYRIAQEALNNVVNHAQAKHVEVTLRCAPQEERSDASTSVELHVSDDGCGFDPRCVPPERLGLGIMRERAHAIGAILTIESRLGGGTHVAVLWKERHRNGTLCEGRKRDD